MALMIRTYCAIWNHSNRFQSTSNSSNCHWNLPMSITAQETGNTLNEKAFDICKRFIDDKCKNGFDCDYPHPKIVCKTLVKTNDGRDTICGQYIPDGLRINDLSNDSTNEVKKYVTCLRRELLQELLLIPYSPSNEKEEHLNNEKLAISTDIWKSILKLHECLTFDYYSLGCHGHAHLCFDSGTWDQLKKESRKWPRDKLISARLNECKYPTPNYLLRNCKDLENYPQYLICESNEKNRQTSEDPVENYYRMARRGETKKAKF
ncbi:10224_t:CDS:2 [Ambispora gerdemannii]|uniref:10224_t:CDS:1 n=1 Tax=Ambispora gerdemannii TaxID=144530 RepID=A0A9N8VJM6_9GLOM|nr:10224_t:CDS:2 [Ambispora gerdemannii]